VPLEIPHSRASSVLGIETLGVSTQKGTKNMAVLCKSLLYLPTH
jgi:hypothetical protein